VYPGAAASLGLLAAKFAKADSAVRQAALAAAAAAGIIASHLAIEGVPKLPPVDSIGWIPVTTALAAVVAITVALLVRVARGVVVGAALMGATAAVAVYLAGKPTFTASLGEFWVPGAMAVAVTSIVVAASYRVASKSHPIAGWIGLLVIAALTALSALWSPSAKLAMLLGSMATTAGVIGVGGLILGVRQAAPLAQGVFVVHFAATLAYARLYANMPAVPVVLLALAVAAPSVIALVPGNRGRLLKAIAVVALAAVFAGIAAMMMHSKSQDNQSDPAGMYG
jgi:hypothetical protein